MQTTKAIQKIKSNGESSEYALLGALAQKQGQTAYDLSKRLGWTYGKTQATVQRLLKMNLIKKKQEIRNNRVIVKLFETPVEEMIDLSEKDIKQMKKYLG